MLVEIQQSWVQEARDIEAKIARSKTLKRKNYTHLSIQQRYYFGTLGHLAFEHLLEEKGKAFRSCHRSDGKADDFDVIAWASGRVLRLDVKTASKANYRRMMIPSAQLARHRRDVYVAVRLEEEETLARMMGWATRTEALEWPESAFGDHGVMTRSQAFSELRSIEELLAQLEDEDGRRRHV